MSEQPRNDSESMYEHVTVVKTIEPDPAHDTPEGHLWFVEGKHFDGDDYRVMVNGQTKWVSTETVQVIKLPEKLPGEEATVVAREQVREVVELSPSPSEWNN